MNSAKGIVYILTNPCMPNYVKIGFTENLKDRLRSLDTTGVAKPFEPYMSVRTSKYKKLEKVIHHELDKLTSTRARANREFFELDPAIAGDLLENLSKLIDDAEINNYGNEIESTSEAPRPISKSTTFKMLNVPIGSTLTPNNNIFPVVLTYDDNNHVSLPNGEVKTISRVADDITNTSRNGFQIYKYNGELLSDMRKKIDKNYLPNARQVKR